MLKVIRKDLILNRNVTIINAVAFLACLVAMSSYGDDLPPKLFAGFGSIMLTFLPISVLAREDKFDALTLGCSLPVRRRTIVQARFLMGWVGGLLGVLVTFTVVGLLPFTLFSPGDLFAVGPLLTAFVMVSLVISMVMPFTMRFGFRGLLILLVALQALGVVLLTLTQMLGSSRDRRLVDTIISGFQSLEATFGLGGARVILVAVVLALLTVAYLVSTWLFERRDV
jgi:ABC-type transport system involved in multi-copper enzyme maturation permease subunit